MSADKAKFRSFSEAQWQEIKASLAERGVDLDACTVGTFVPGKARWWLVDDSDAWTKEPRNWIDVDGEIVPRPRQEPLRDALKAVAWCYWHYDDPFIWGEKPSLTPILLYLQKTVAAFEDALHAIDRIAVDRMESNDYTDDERDDDLRVCNAMADYIDRQQERIAKLKAVGRTGNQNARTRHNGYWHELARLWLGITGGVGPKRRQRLHSFLSACTPPTMFPDMTARQLSEKLDSIVNNCFR